MSVRRKKPVTQPLLPFSPVRNSCLLSEHWLEHRLKLEPEWAEARQHADEALTNLLDLWRVQRSRVEQYGDEAGLEQAFIQPVLQALGWEIKYQTYLDRREPDYALFENDTKLDAALKAGRRRPGFWKHPTLLADAKAWHVSLDRPTRIGSKREYPPEQIEWYLERSRLDFAILTNGRLWRLIPRERELWKPRFQTFLEVDLPRLLDEWSGRQRTFDAVEFDDFFRFFLFFRPGTFHPVEDRLPLIRRAIQGSSEYCLSVGEDLKERVFEALRLCIEGFLAYSPNALSPGSDLEMCREQSFIFLYRLLFVMYAEDRALLPYRVNRTYTTNRSLARHRDEIAARLDNIGDGHLTPYSDTSTGIWESLSDLFDLLDHGHGRYGVPAYNGGLFDSSRHEFLNTKMLPDSYLAEVIDQLGRAPNQAQPDTGLFRVDYRDLAIQHLGSVYEGLLEARPRYATMPMVMVRKEAREKRTELIQPESQHVPAGFEATETRYKAGSVYLQTDKGERRSFGSYYTPEHIVDCIVRHTLGPICAEIDRRLSEEIAETKAKVKRSRGRSRTLWQEKLDGLRNDFDDRVLALCVLDPAMGSGHFLVRACQYLAEEIATNPHTGDSEAEQIEGDEPTLTYWKRRVIESSIFGVDINRMAVELAKLALWLETVSSDQPLSFLDHHFRPGNSLVGGRVSELGALPDPTPLLRNAFRDQLQQRLPILLQPLSDIRAMPSNDAQQIKEKEKLYRKVFQPISNAFNSVADLWTSSFFADRADQPNPEDYAKALESLQDPKMTNKLLQEERYQTALASVRSQEVACFHWELEFPEVFFDKAGRRDECGFDAIIGNPPWGHAGILEAVEEMSRFDPVVDDHAECFICLATGLIARNGRIGMVLPDTILSPAKSKIREHMLTQTRTTDCYNIGPDWFTAKIRMSTVLWLASGTDPSLDDYSFDTCILPITLRRASQAGQISLPNAIKKAKRQASSRCCLGDPECGIPLFGDSDSIRLLDQAFHEALTLGDLCDHARGVELNKAGEVLRCPHCAKWDAPPRRDSHGSFHAKTCTHCGQEYRSGTHIQQRFLVSDLQARGSQWKPFIDGDSIRRYSVPAVRCIDTSATGINYKPEDHYRSPKILIRQAGIGVNAILDVSNAFCPQSVYMYHVKDQYRTLGIDESLTLSMVCSRLFHLQVFTSFGEIDSSRAFSKLTHKRLSRLCAVAPAKMSGSPELIQRIRSSVAVLTAHGLSGHEQEDWDIEACWTGIVGLSKDDVVSVIRNFNHVHAGETLLSLFPGGIAGRESYWVDVWRQAASRCGVTL